MASPNFEPWRLGFPDVCIEDVAAATQRVVEHLGIEQLCAVMGPSMGGMTTLAWATPVVDNGFVYFNF